MVLRVFSGDWLRLFWDLEVSLRSFHWDWAGCSFFFKFFFFCSGVLPQEGPFFIGILDIGTSFEKLVLVKTDCGQSM